MQNWKNMINRRERIRLKIWICVLGILVLLFLFLGRMAVNRNETPPAPEAEREMHVPVIQKLSHVWIIEAGEDNLLLYRDGEEESYDYGVVKRQTGEDLKEGSENEETGKNGGVSAGAEEERLYQPDWGIREQMADVILTDGRVTDVKVLKEKIHGVILSADEGSIEVEGYGHIPLAKDYRGYRIYNTLAMCGYQDLAFGYDFADLVLEDGEICGILMVREETMDSIRVLIKTADYEDLLHKQLTLTADTDYVVCYGMPGGEKEELHGAGEAIDITMDSGYWESERLVVRPTALTGKILLRDVGRNQGIPGYRGHMELLKEKGGIAVVNEVSLEEYLYSVVPSEMPASYPAEALEAQAICARTYAYGHMRHAAYPNFGAHVDDSTSFQVYNNILEQDSTTKAVKETHGQLLCTAEGGLAETYYYSTSCGVGSDARVWKTEAAPFITYLKPEAINETAMREKLMLREQAEAVAASASTQEDLGERLREEAYFADFISAVNPDDFEVKESWYRWTYEVKKVSAEHVCEILKKRYRANDKLVLTLKKGKYVSSEPEEFTQIKELYIADRGGGGVADELILETDKGSYKVISEHNIRYVLCDGESRVRRQNGGETVMPNLLPSGFFIIETSKKNGNVIGYKLTGGGFGHGVGMSQNGARAMAVRGYSCEEILLFFYENCSLEHIY